MSTRDEVSFSQDTVSLKQQPEEEQHETERQLLIQIWLQIQKIEEIHQAIKEEQTRRMTQKPCCCMIS